MLIGASSVAQLEENVAAVGKTSFSEAELAEIDKFAREGELDLWAGSSSG